MNRRWKNIYVVYCLLIMACILSVNPRLFSAKPLMDWDGAPSQTYLPSFQWRSFSSSSTNEMKDVVYRGSQERLGQFPIPNELKRDGKLQKLWTESDFNVGIHGASKASPVADWSGVYVGSDKAWFYAFNTDGSIRWKYHASDASRGIHSTALLDEKHVYFGTYSGWFYCFEKQSGNLIWSRKIGETVGSSPISFGNSLIVAVETYQPNGYLVRMKKDTGEFLWISEHLGQQSHSSPVIDEKGRQVLLGANNSIFFSFDLDSGVLKWKIPVGGPVKGTPVIVGDRVFFSDWGRYFWSLNLKDGSTAWKSFLEGDSQSSAAFFPKSQLLAISDKKSNLRLFHLDGQLALEKKLPNKKMTSSPVALVGDRELMLLTCQDQVLCLMNLKGQVLQRFSLDGLLTGIPFVYLNRIYLSVDSGSFYALEIR